MTDLTPDLHLRCAIGLERSGPFEERDGVLDLVAADGELGGAPEPEHRPLANGRELGLRARPRQVGLGGIRGGGVVVREQAACSSRRPSPVRSNHFANCAWRCARFAFGRLSYATSRVSACLIANSRSPLIDELGRCRMKSRSSSSA